MIRKIIFLGAPGVGKGTIAKLLARDLDIPHISTGDIFRSEIKNNTELGKKIIEITQRGDYVPDDLTNKIIEKSINNPNAKDGYILDGYPRTIPQTKFLRDNTKIDVAILLETKEDLIIKRLNGRRTCLKCKTGYHIKFQPPKKEGICDIDGEKLTQRKDDSKEAIQHRIKTYKKETIPLIEFYKKEGILEAFDSSTNPDKIIKEIKGKLFND
ncbi:MAG: nucleoside monophosphate kinase [Mycoplasma sp.]|nr:nucleoside monophosphate kinase [Mycoplasma sp.]